MRSPRGFLTNIISDNFRRLFLQVFASANPSKIEISYSNLLFVVFIGQQG